MRGIVIIILLIGVLLILSSCTSENPQTVQETSETSTPVTSTKVTETVLLDPCKNVKCGDKQVCSEGKCVCSTNYKDCQGECISASKCCTSKDCSADKKCENSECVDANLCDYLQHWDNAQNKCICNAKTKWCVDQEKCIPYDKCCGVKDCNLEGGLITRVCRKTEFTPSLCIGDDSSTHCINIKTNRVTKFKFGNSTRDVIVDQIFAGGIINLKLEGRTPFKVPPKTKLQILDDVWVRVDDVTTSGGNCKEDQN